MSIESQYYCDLCENEKLKNELYGLCFTANADLRLENADKGAKRHICKTCLIQLKDQQ